MKTCTSFALAILFVFAFNFSNAQQEMNAVSPSASAGLINHSAGNSPAPPCAPVAPNNNYANAVVLTVGAAALAGSTCMGTLQGGEAVGCNTGATQSVWYRFTATAGLSYVLIDATGSTCYVGSAIWPGSSLPTDRCTMIDCQSADYGPLVTAYRITGAVGTTYSVQVVYTNGGLCGSQGIFTIRVANAYAGTLTNPGSTNTCAAASPGCYFLTPPTVATVTGACPGYPLNTLTNLVNNYFVTFTTAAVNSIQLSFQDIIQSTCGAGNVDWFFYRLFDANCNLVACGDLGNLQSNVACNTTYILEYMWEELPCTYTTQWPFQYIPTGTVGCGTLPVKLLSFDADVKNKEVTLKWETASEIENDYFTVERSSDAFAFEKIAKINGAINSSEVIPYQLTDELPGLGKYYYRLKQTDINGDFTYSKVISVNCGAQHSLVISNGNDGNSVNVIFQSGLNGNRLLTVYDSKGVKVGEHEQYCKGGPAIIKLDMSNYNPGVYHCVVISDDEILQQQFIRY